jgi:hypothetical protein
MPVSPGSGRGLPVPFEAELAPERVRTRVRAGVIKPGDMHPEHAHLRDDRRIAFYRLLYDVTS